mgnify:CR=1 FL=1
MLTRQKPASRCSLPEHIEEATFYLASVLVVEWLATFNQKRKMEQGKGERSCPLFSGNPPKMKAAIATLVEKEGAGKEEQPFGFGT